MKKQIIFLSIGTILFFIISSCSYKYRTTACTDHIFVDGISGNNMILHYPIIWKFDSVWYYSMTNKYKIIGFDLVTYYSSGARGKKIINKSKTNLITDEMKKSYLEGSSAVDRLVFKNFILEDKNGQRVKNKANKKISIDYFAVEKFD